MLDKKNYWKLLAIICIGYSFFSGLFAPVPQLPILNESIRNLFFHVPMWFTMLVLFSLSVYYSIKHLQTNNFIYDIKAECYANVGLLFGTLGIITGSIWAKYTWGEWWSGDPKQNSAAVALLIYLSYVILRSSIDEEQRRAKISAVYNIFAFPIMIVLIYVLPKMSVSLHPGTANDPSTVASLSMDMRLIFYPACLGWILIGLWISELRYRIFNIKNIL